MTISPKLSLWYASVVKLTFWGVGEILQAKAYKISPPNIHSLPEMGLPAVGFSPNSTFHVLSIVFKSQKCDAMDRKVVLPIFDLESLS